MVSKDRLAEYHSKRDLGRSGEPSAGQALDSGHLRVRLHGQKLSGAYSLVHTRMGGSHDKEQWLLVKKDDESADRRRKPASTQPESVLSGKHNDDFRE